MIFVTSSGIREGSSPSCGAREAESAQVPHRRSERENWVREERKKCGVARDSLPRESSRRPSARIRVIVSERILAGVAFDADIPRCRAAPAGFSAVKERSRPYRTRQSGEFRQFRRGPRANPVRDQPPSGRFSRGRAVVRQENSWKATFGALERRAFLLGIKGSPSHRARVVSPHASVPSQVGPRDFFPRPVFPRRARNGRHLAAGRGLLTSAVNGARRLPFVTAKGGG